MIYFHYFHPKKRTLIIFHTLLLVKNQYLSNSTRFDHKTIIINFTSGGVEAGNESQFSSI